MAAAPTQALRPPWTLVERAGVTPRGTRLAPDTGGDYYEVYATPVTRAVLRLTDSWTSISEAEIQRRLSEGDSAWTAEVRDPMTGRWYDVIDTATLEEFERFGIRLAALDRASRIERDVADARVGMLPDWQREDLTQWLLWFQTQVPNRIDYVRLLWGNDPNGAYDGLLAGPVREVEAVFFEAFEDHLPAQPNPVPRVENTVARAKAELLW